MERQSMTDQMLYPRSKTARIPCFTDCDELNIQSYQHNCEDCGLLVSISQHSGSLRLNHSMTPAQAREMAAALVSAADWIEANQVAYE